MLKLLAGIVELINKLFGLWHDSQVATIARQQDQKVLDDHVAQAENAVAVADPVRDERLRDRFDRSADRP